MASRSDKITVIVFWLMVGLFFSLTVIAFSINP